MAASMTLDIQNTDKLAGFKNELNRLGIAILPRTSIIPTSLQRREGCDPLRARRAEERRRRRDAGPVAERRKSGRSSR